MSDRTCKTCSKQYRHEPMFIDGLDMLDHIFVCESCSESSRKAYEQAEWKATAKLRWEEAIPVEYRNTDITHPDYQKSIESHEAALTWLRQADAATRRPFLGLVGASGGCKSRIASQIAKQGIWEHGFYQWCGSYKFQWACQNQFGDDGKEASRLLRTCRETANLIFDDLGSLKSSEVVSDTLYALLEHRSANSLPMIWTSNEQPEEMLSGKNLTEKERARNISRLKGYSEIIEL